MADPGSSQRNVRIMGQGRADTSRVVPTVRGTAVPTVSQQGDPYQAAFDAWLIKTYPMLTGMGGATKRKQLLPKLTAEFAPIWQRMQQGAQPAAAAPVTLGDLIQGGTR